MASSSADAGSSPRGSWSMEAMAAVVRDRWGLEGSLEPLPGERDQNALLTASDGTLYVVKLTALGEDEETLTAQDLALQRLAQADTPFNFPEPVPGVEGALLSRVMDEEDLRFLRVLRHVPGTPMAAVNPQAPELFQGAGELLGTVTRTLWGWDHPGAHRELSWDLRAGYEVARANLEHVPVEGGRRARVEVILEEYRSRVQPVENELRRGLVHGDGNDHNILVGPPGDDLLDPRPVTGLIDFGDLVHSWLCAEPAIAAAYAMLDKKAPLDAVVHLVRGYASRFPLTALEADVLWVLARLRLAVSVTRSALRRSLGEEDAYLYVSEGPAWALLDRLGPVPSDLARYRIREACGLEPCPTAVIVRGWLVDHRNEIGPVLDPDPAGAHRRTLDLSVGSAELSPLRGREDAEAWSEVVEGLLREEGAQVGVGLYDEARHWYRGELYRVATDGAPAARAVHMGVDLFVPPGTPVLAPLPGTVESVVVNEGPLDYGPTVILRHKAGPAGFHTLFGHLSQKTLDHVAAGQTVERGDVIGWIGDHGENGGWPPHLHLQIVTDLLGNEGEFPGVALPSQRTVWRSLSPDPNLLLRFPEGCRARGGPEIQALLDRRRERLAPNLSISYRNPLHIVRGRGAHLYDPDGQPYLDCVNNVAHVGHSHPRVVDALYRQATVLNTNTRYLHGAILDYAERLAALVRGPLEVCWLVCSGSEANELALRLARAHTGRRDVVVLEGGYHGNTSSLVELSPYKFDGPGGSGRPPWVQVAAMPDPYRGRHPGPDGAEAYAADVARACADSTRSGTGPAAFFAEAILSCGGQIEPPSGYLPRAYEAVRDAGGLCVADEVQVGFGRVGSHWWAFQALEAVPDIVTMGKPMGNGHPLGAVLTTREIANSFDTGMEYFNTFGGNPPAASVGLAVLDILEEDGLRRRAARVGAYLKERLLGLMDHHPAVGDVRGRGLFLGVELVLDRSSRVPAPRHAAYVVERARELGVLLSTDGPDHNVIKIKPPLVFTESDADLLVETLDRVLAEDAVASSG